VEDINVDGDSALGFGSDLTAIIDTGTTYVTLPRDAFDGVRNLLSSHASRLPGLQGPESLFEEYCIVESEIERAGGLAAWPTLKFVLTGVEVEMPAELYLIKIMEPGFGWVYCLGIDTGFPDLPTILGASLLRGYFVSFDRDGMRVGFAPRNETSGFCGSPTGGGSIRRLFWNRVLAILTYSRLFNLLSLAVIVWSLLAIQTDLKKARAAGHDVSPAALWRDVRDAISDDLRTCCGCAFDDSGGGPHSTDDEHAALNGPAGEECPAVPKSPLGTAATEI
jgi:hypothetical protein